MADTPNYNLNKPDKSDKFLIEKWNQNMDTIDAAMKELKDAAENASGGFLMGQADINPDHGGALIIEPIIGIPIDPYDVDYKPDGMPESSGLYSYFDLTNYSGESSILNPCRTDNFRSFNIIGGIIGDNELLLNSKSSSYATTSSIHTKDAFTTYMILKCDKNVNAYTCLYDNSYNDSSANMCCIESYNNNIQFDGYAASIASKVPPTQYNIICLCGRNNIIELWINSTLIGTQTNYNIGSYISFGCAYINGSTSRYYNNPLRVKCLIACKKTHSSEDIIANSEWMRNKFLS